MSDAKYYLAIDLAVGRSRFVVGELSGNRIHRMELGSFETLPVREEGVLYWDIEQIFEEVKVGICRALKMFGENLLSVGVTAWGDDFGLFDRAGSLLQKPMCYYEQDNREWVRLVKKTISPIQLFSQSAAHNNHLTSLYQLLALKNKQPKMFRSAQTFLTIPDIINYWLTGKQVADQTNASSTQLYKAKSDAWAEGLIEKLGLPVHIFPEIKPPGARLGLLQDSLAEELSISHPLQVVLPGCHDSASALAAIPNPGGNFAYLSSGTWAILGVVIKKPLVTKKAMEWGFTNECGVGNGVNLLRVMIGLWALEQCREVWAKEDGSHLSWETIADMALDGSPFLAVVDMTDDCFSQVGDMPVILNEYCKKTKQAKPQRREDVVRVLMEGLALCYRHTIEQLEELTDQRIYCLHVAGYGARNYALNQFTANALNRRVVAGPFDATAFGSLIMQMISMGEIASVDEGKAIVKNSIMDVVVDPQHEEGWDEAFAKLARIKRGATA